MACARLLTLGQITEVPSRFKILELYACVVIHSSVHCSDSEELFLGNLGRVKVITGFPDGSALKNPPAMQELQETQVQVPSLGGEDPLDEEIAAHSSILARRIPWTEEPGRLWSKASQRAGHNQSDLTHIHTKSLLEDKMTLMLNQLFYICDLGYNNVNCVWNSYEGNVVCQL